MDDGPIIARCLAGESEAFEMLVAKYQSGVLSLAWSVLGNRAEAEDAAQEAFLRAYTHLKQFDHSRNFRGWLSTIAFSLCLDRLKKQRTERRFRPEVYRTTNPSPFGQESERRFEQTATFEPLLRKLNPKERVALSLAATQGYSAAEVAEVLRCAESTARVYIFKARRKLRKWLKGNADDRNP
jgi:RNA polymerase sigma-70 factor (ECF subfamily)